MKTWSTPDAGEESHPGQPLDDVSLLIALVAKVPLLSRAEEVRLSQRVQEGLREMTAKELMQRVRQIELSALEKLRDRRASRVLREYL